MELGSLALSYAAGALSTLSPCVLPLLPILLASAVQQHVLGPLALALGLSVSFAGMGLFAASLGFTLDIDASALRVAAALLMLALGIVLLVPALQAELTQRMGPLTTWASGLRERLRQAAPALNSCSVSCWASCGRLAPDRRLARALAWLRSAKRCCRQPP